MKATKIVYALITILALIPIFVKRIKRIRNYTKSGQKPDVRRQFLYLILACAIILSFTISLYRFTIGYEAPLVAEQVSDILVTSRKDRLGQDDFEELLYRKKLAEDVNILGYDDVWNSINFEDSYDAALSERTYTEGDLGILYCKYTQGDITLYIEMKFAQHDTKWKLSTFEVSDEEELKNIDSKMRFLTIN